MQVGGKIRVEAANLVEEPGVEADGVLGVEFAVGLGSESKFQAEEFGCFGPQRSGGEVEGFVCFGF